MNFLPGWSHGFVAGRTPLTTITQVLSATSTGSTISVPSGVQAGDLIVLFDAAGSSNTSIPTQVIPSGFTSIVDNTLVASGAAGQRNTLSYKIASGTEGSTSLTGMNGSNNNRKALLVFRGNVPAAIATVGDAAGQATDGNPSEQIVNASGGVAPLVVIGTWSLFPVGGTVDPRSFSPAKDGEINPTAQMYMAWKIYNTAPADVSVDMTDEGAGNTLQSCYIEMA